MLNAWHQPVPPFVVKQGQRLDITLWLQGDELPERVFCAPNRTTKSGCW